MNKRTIQVEWDTDGVVVDDLPKLVTIPAGLEDWEVSEWLSDSYGYCVLAWSE